MKVIQTGQDDCITLVPKYQRRKHLKKASEYCIGPYNSYCKCAKDTLTRRNTEFGNAWTMIVLLWLTMTDIVHDIDDTNTSGWTRQQLQASLLCSFAVGMHAIFSIGNHIFKAHSLHVSRTWQHLDVAFIYIHQCLVHIALLQGSVLPWSVCVLTAAPFILITSRAVQHVITLDRHANASREVGNKYLAVVLFHFIPIMAKMWSHPQKRTSIASLFGIMFTCGVVHKLKIPERFTKSIKYGYSHEYMHIGLWAAYFLSRLLIT